MQVKGGACRYKVSGKRRPISAEEKELFIALYPDMDTAELAEKLGRSVRALYGMSDKFGVKKSDEYQAEKRRLEAARLRDSGVVHRYPKGHVPANKGLRRPGWNRGRMAETQFKKGERGNTWKPLGSERIDSKQGYILVKVSDGQPLNYRAKHNIVWEEANDPIPKGYCVTFKDGNKLNCSLVNLELITREQLMLRNTMHNYPEPVRQQIHALAGFRRKLNNHAKKQNRRSA